jgi:HEAT repeat protein
LGIRNHQNGFSLMAVCFNAFVPQGQVGPMAMGPAAGNVTSMWWVLALAIGLVPVGCSTENSGSSGAASGPGVAQAASAKEAAKPVKRTPEEEASAAAFQTLVDVSHGSGNADDWAKAEASLRQIGKAAVPVLANALVSEDQTARELASMFLAELGPDAVGAGPQLKAALADSSHFVRGNAASTLTTFEQNLGPLVPVLADLLAVAEPSVRLTAARSLANTGEANATQTIAALVAALQDSETAVQLAAAESLGKLGAVAKTAIPNLSVLNSNASPELVAAAQKAVRLISGQPADSNNTALPVSAEQPAP